MSSVPDMLDDTDADSASYNNTITEELMNLFTDVFL